MAKYKDIEIIDKQVWEGFVLSRNPKSFLHSWNWGETQKLSGKDIYRFGLFDQDTLIGVCLMILEKAKRGTHILIPGGPILNWENEELVNEFIKITRRKAKEFNAWFVRIRPEVQDNDANREKFKKLGFKKSPMHLHAQNTWILDITKSEEELLAGMRKNTRYAIKQSMKNDLRLTVSIDPKDTKDLCELQKVTAARNKFVGFSDKLFKSQLLTFGKDGEAKIFTVLKGKTPLVSAIIIFYGESAYYHHSGSADEARDTNASYFLQWEVIKHAKKSGYKSYNFWGVSPTRDPKHRFYGVTIFKTGFGGFQIDWLPAQDEIISKFYYLTYAFEMFRKTLRRL